MHHETLLRQLATETVSGDIPPFSTGDLESVEAYIRTIAGRLSDIRTIVTEADFSYYGSGFASYIPVRISMRDGSDTIVSHKGNQTERWTRALLLYICNLAPYWYYGGSEWTVTTVEGAFKSGSSGFLSAASIDDIDEAVWRPVLLQIRDIMELYGYVLLKREALEETVQTDIPLCTVLGDKPYTVFDYFFHWED